MKEVNLLDVLFANSENEIAVAGDDGWVRFINLDSADISAAYKGRWHERHKVILLSGGEKALTYSPFKGHGSYSESPSLFNVKSEQYIKCFSEKSSLSVASDGGDLFAFFDEGGAVVRTGESSYYQFVKMYERGTHVAACFCADDKAIITGHRDGSVNLWVPPAPEVKSDFNTPVAVPVYATRDKVVHSPKLDVFDNMINVMLGRHAEQVTAVAAGFQHNICASGSSDGIVHLWDIDSQSLLGSLYSDGSYVSAKSRLKTVSVDVDALGSMLAVAYENKTIRVWDLKIGKLKFSVESASIPQKIAISHDGSHIAVLLQTGMAQIWDLATKTTACTISLKSFLVRVEITSIAFNNDCSVLLCGCRDGSIRHWDVKRKTQILMQKLHKGPVRSISFNKDGIKAVTASSDGTACILTSSDQKKPVVLKGDGTPLRYAFFSSDGCRVLSVHEDGSIRIWDATSGKIIVQVSEDYKVHPPKRFEEILSVSFDGSGSRVFLHSKNGMEYELFEDDNHGWELFSSHETPAITGVRFRYYKWIGGDLIVIDVLNSGDIIFHKNGLICSTIDSGVWCNAQDSVDVTDLRVSPDGQTLAVGYKSGVVGLWRGMGEHSFSLVGHADPICSLAFNSKGSLLATASRNGTVAVWGTESGQNVQTFNIVALDRQYRWKWRDQLHQMALERARPLAERARCYANRWPIADKSAVEHYDTAEAVRIIVKSAGLNGALEKSRKDAIRAYTLAVFLFIIFEDREPRPDVVDMYIAS